MRLILTPLSNHRNFQSVPYATYSIDFGDCFSISELFQEIISATRHSDTSRNMGHTARSL